MSAREFLFAIITLLPLPLLCIGAIWGGAWIVVAFIYLSVFTFALDELVAIASNPDEAEVEFPAATKLSVALAMAHFALMALAVLALTGTTGLAVWERVLVFFAFGLFFGQVSNSNAHELIHRSSRVLHNLGKWVFISHLFGHHTSAHAKVHHRYVGSNMDPNSARLGEPYYRFAARAWVGSFRRGLAVETEAWQASPHSWWHHPYVTYVAGAIVFLLLAALTGGVAGIFAYVALAGHATAQLLLSDYVQHYGLRRKIRADGQLEPVGPRHSWNSPHWFSNYLMLAAPRHSDHHAHPTRQYPALQLPAPEIAPTLPRSLPVMGFIALHPARWRRMMDPLAAKWS